MKKKLVIIGVELFAEVAKAYFEEYTSYYVCAFACHRAYKNKETFSGIPVVAIEDMNTMYPPETHDVFVAVGYSRMNQTRQSLFQELVSREYECTSFIHPDVKIWNSTKIGNNVFIFEDNTIQPFTNIGSNTILWSGNHIGHHSSIGENCFITSHVVISGSCKIGNNVFIGVNATLRDDISIGDYVLIGAGSIIMRSAKDKEVYIPNATKKFVKTSDQLKL